MKLLRWFLRRQVRIAAGFFVPFGIAMIVLGLILYGNEWRFARSAHHAAGTITMMESRVDQDNREFFYPHFTFSKSDGTVVEVSSNVGTNPPDFEVGQQVPVVFDASDPRTAKIATTFQMYAFSIIVELVAIGLIAIGFLARFLRRKFFPV